VSLCRKCALGVTVLANVLMGPAMHVAVVDVKGKSAIPSSNCTILAFKKGTHQLVFFNKNKTKYKYKNLNMRLALFDQFIRIKRTETFVHISEWLLLERKKFLHQPNNLLLSSYFIRALYVLNMF